MNMKWAYFGGHVSKLPVPAQVRESLAPSPHVRSSLPTLAQTCSAKKSHVVCYLISAHQLTRYLLATFGVVLGAICKLLRDEVAEVSGVRPSKDARAPALGVVNIFEAAEVLSPDCLRLRGYIILFRSRTQTFCAWERYNHNSGARIPTCHGCPEEDLLCWEHPCREAGCGPVL